MSNYSIVIGGLWGDEGKGHMTDILCSEQKNTLNIRFNGGGQASHTVVTPDGKRYAFRHVGAGTFSGADTYLSEDFIVNPVLFDAERRTVYEKFGINVSEFVNSNAIVTTLWDMYINQVVEMMRGEDRHGSCGLGINETVERSKYDKYSITVSTLTDKEVLFSKLKRIEEEYVPFRLEEYELSVDTMPKEYRELFNDKDNINMFMFYSKEFLSAINITDDSIINEYDNVVFEGAQGLLLDQCSQFVPHVTSSNTGINNVMKVLKNLNFNNTVDVYYMCRCYATKHGAGYFPGETSINDYASVIDETNVPNDFQGSLRFGMLNLDLLADAINKDLTNLRVNANINICITCMDQISKNVSYIVNDVHKSTSKEEFLVEFKKYMKESLSSFDSLYVTDGLTRENYYQV